MLTKNGLPELLAPTYARAKRIDPNEAYRRLERGCEQVGFVERTQNQVWQAVLRRRPDEEEASLLARLEKRLAKSKRYQPMKFGRKEDIAMTAWGLYCDVMSGFATGEAADLIASPEGALLLEQGLVLVADHLAKELLR